VVADVGCWTSIDMDLAGLVQAGSGWKAVLRRVERPLLVVGPGYRFCDATLEAVDREGATLRRGPATWRWPLAVP